MAASFQTLAPAPGEATASPAPSTPASGGGQPDPMGGLTSLLPLALMVPFVLMLFWSGRSQSKKHQKLISELKKGDGVLTQGGMRGKLVEIGDRYAKVEIAPGTKIEVLRSAIVGRDDVETAAQLEKK